jgi:hypothetical protein
MHVLIGSLRPTTITVPGVPTVPALPTNIEMRTVAPLRTVLLVEIDKVSMNRQVAARRYTDHKSDI